jgi:hypothetical protein
VTAVNSGQSQGFAEPSGAFVASVESSVVELG